MARATKAAAKKATAKAKTGAATAVDSRTAAQGVGESPADVVDAQLAKYRSMRDFHITQEPAGGVKDGAATKAALPFCIQKHAASHLHYDFRLGWNGVLKSWAVAKGPSYFVGDKRLAVQVEDHPMEYGGFEGIIPAGQYGGGTVMLWDQGTWEPQAGHTDVDAGLRDGSLKFVMHGTKMKGKWALIRMGGKAATERKPNWLLIKEHDEFERPADAEAVTEAESKSVVTGRDLDQIAKNEDHVWNSKETAGTGQAWYRKVGTGELGAGRERANTGVSPLRSASVEMTAAGGGPSRTSGTIGRSGSKQSNELIAILQERLKGLPKEVQPGFLKPQLAIEATSPPEGAGWVHELKLDGYRIQARKSGEQVEMLTRSGLDWAYRVPAMAAAVSRLRVGAATLDGEVVVLRGDGTTNFADLQASFQEVARNPLTYFCFDLLHLEGRNTRGLPLTERKELLGEVLAGGEGDEIRLSEHIEASGEAVFHRACELHAEGIVSKRAEGPYRAGRGGDWMKSKCLLEQEFVVGGFTFSSDGEDRVGSLLLGYYRDGRLVYAGRTGTGFTQKMRRMLRERMEPMRIAKAAYAAVPVEAKRGAVWVRPELVAQVRFATWTADDLVRQAAFLGLREDKPAEEVRREGAEVAPRPKGGRRGAGGESDEDEAGEANIRGETATNGAPGLGAGAKAGEVEAPAKFYVRPRRPKGAAEVKAEHAEATAKAGLSGMKGEDVGAAVLDGGEAGSFAALRMTKRSAGADTGKEAKAGADAAPMDHAPVRLTHPEKILDVQSGVTKRMLADFYWAVADRMLPHIANRPLSLVRCPEGSEKPCFFQKHVNHMLPKGIGGVDVPNKKTGEMEPYITLPGPPAGKEALTGLAQMGVLEVHPWGSHNDDLERPDRLTFDLDPDEALGWGTVTDAAAELRKRLKTIGLESLLKTTGGKGLHVVAPIVPGMEWPEAKEFAYQFVRSMERANPALYLTKMTKAARAGKIYLDYLRNERGATAVAPYSPRARAGMGVSMPLAWSELKLAERPVFRVAELGKWGARLKKDPWPGIDRMQQEVTAEAKRAVGMKG